MGVAAPAEESDNWVNPFGPVPEDHPRECRSIVHTRHTVQMISNRADNHARVLSALA